MPHVIVKLWPGKSDDQKQRLTETITRGVIDTLDYGEDAVSVAFEEVSPRRVDAQSVRTRHCREIGHPDRATRLRQTAGRGEERTMILNETFALPR